MWRTTEQGQVLVVALLLIVRLTFAVHASPSVDAAVVLVRCASDRKRARFEFTDALNVAGRTTPTTVARTSVTATVRDTVPIVAVDTVTSCLMSAAVSTPARLANAGVLISISDTNAVSSARAACAARRLLTACTVEACVTLAGE